MAKKKRPVWAEPATMPTFPFIAKITSGKLMDKPAGSISQGKIWRYGFTQITTPFTQNIGVLRVMAAQNEDEQEGRLAVVIDDIQRDASQDDPQKPPLLGAVVMILYYNNTPYIVSGHGLTDVRYSPEDDRFYKTIHGSEEEWAKSTKYPPDND